MGILSLFKRKSKSDGIVGERCVVVERIDNNAGCGEVRVKDRFGQLAVFLKMMFFRKARL